MIEYDRIVPGMTAYWMDIDFTWKGALSKPQSYTPREVWVDEIENKGAVIISWIGRPKERKTSHRFPKFSYGRYEYPGSALYDSLEECKADWNSRLYSERDKLSANLEKLLNRLDNVNI